ncbi:MAG: hypothetical protein HOP19_21850 [Acidobacteria bacterium]|nr:hypothetical protein [Acidobacteriota bacterium]
MDDVIVLINQIGPLPFSVTFDARADGPVTFFLSGSAWTQTSNTEIGIGMELDGVPIGSAVIFANAAGCHMAVVPVFVRTKLTFGQHTLSLLPTNATTTTDLNDFFHVSLHL